jgi:hypothetical protein
MTETETFSKMSDTIATLTQLIAQKTSLYISNESVEEKSQDE